MRNVESVDWILFIVVAQVAGFAWLRYFYPNRASLLFNAYFSNRFVNQLTREERTSQGLFNILLELIYFINFALFAYLINQEFGLIDLPATGFAQFVVIGLTLVLLILLKSLSINTMVWMYDLETVFGEVSFYRFLSHSLLSVALLPLLIIAVYLPFKSQLWIYLGLGMLALSFLYRLIRSALRFSTAKSFSLKYIILYICALEILPVLLLVKWSMTAEN